MSRGSAHNKWTKLKYTVASDSRLDSFDMSNHRDKTHLMSHTLLARRTTPSTHIPKRYADGLHALHMRHSPVPSLPDLREERLGTQFTTRKGEIMHAPQQQSKHPFLFTPYGGPFTLARYWGEGLSATAKDTVCSFARLY